MAASGVRVTGGRLGGRRLHAPAAGVRPTSDRVRESLFTRLGDLEGTTVLDLYAGTGVLGAEAMSRGATEVVFVERAARCVSVLKENLKRLGLDAHARVIAADAVRALHQLGRRGETFDLVLLDPPYAAEEVPRALEALCASGILASGATVVVEHHRRHPVPIVPGLKALDSREYGDTVITRLLADPSGRENGGPGAA
jgi:16S rRNA (guanine966-N2)-methyltransferase